MPNPTATSRPEAEADEFEAAFAQAGREIAGSTPPAGQEQQPNDPAAHDAGGHDEQLEAQASAASSADGQPAERADKPADGSAQSQPAAQQRPAGSTVEELERALADALHRERSVAHRISAADRRSNDLQRENEQLKRRIAELERAAPATAAAGASNPDDVLSQSPELQEAVQRRIQAATADLMSRLDAATSRLNELGEAAERTASQVKPVVERQAMDAIASVHQALDGRFGQKWRDDIRSVPFKAWLAQQSAAIKDIYENSVSARDTAAVLDLFYAGRGQHEPAGVQSTTTTQSAAGQAAARTTTQQDRLREAAGIATAGRSAPTRPDPNDFDAAFAEASQQIRASKKD